MSTETIALVSEYRDLPVSQLQESLTNPRRRFDARSLEEMAASFRAQGILQPLLVRPLHEGFYEVVAGARRLRAARIAEMEAVPTRVREMTDAQVIEAQAIENLQREEIHPLEEALAYKNMLELEGGVYTAASIAEKLGKSPSYITQRLRLTELIEPVAQAFLDERIGVGHALEIAKLQPFEQERAFEAAFRSVWTGTAHTPLLVSVRDLATWIQQNILLELDSVPFDKDDVALLPEAGACTQCLKRTGYNTLLFSDASRDSCSDAACFNAKIGKYITQQVEAKPKLVQISTSWNPPHDSSVLGRNQYVALQLARKPTKRTGPLTPSQKPCTHMTEAIVTEGAERGRTIKVCADPTCTIHFADRRAPDPKEIEKQKEQRRKELLKRKLEATVRHRTLAEILKKVDAPLDRNDLAMTLQILLDRSDPVRRETLARRCKIAPSQLVGSEKVRKELTYLIRKMDETALSRLLIEWVLLPDVENVSHLEPEYLPLAAKHHRVDVAKVRETVTKELAAKQVKTAAKQKKVAATTAGSLKKQGGGRKLTPSKKAA